MDNKTKIIISIVVVAIIVLSTFTAVTYYQVSDLAATAEETESLPIIAAISADKTEGIIPLEVSFMPIVSNSVGKVEYFWDFGDGNTSKETKPIYIYKENGTFICNLTVKDKNGKKASDNVKIKVTENHLPTVSIEFTTDKPIRPKSWLLEYIIPAAGRHIENYGGNDYRKYRDKGWLDPLFKGEESFYTLEAAASDEDGDEIVSYEWVLKGDDYNERITNKKVIVSYNYTGKIINIPTKDIYPARPYSITLTVTDSAGKKRSANLKFEVQKSQDRAEWESFTGTLKFYKTKWISEIHSGVVGGIALLLLGLLLTGLNNRLPEIVSFPVIKLLFMLIMSLILQTKPDEYSDESINEVIERIIYKPRIIFKGLNPEKFKKLFDGIEQLGKIPLLSDLAFKLQILEEDVGLDNKRPLISNPFPETGSNNVPINCPQVSITVEDPEGDPFDVTISGTYVNNVTYTDQYNGTFTASLITPLPETEEIYWKVTVVDKNEKSGIYRIYVNSKEVVIVDPEFTFKTLY